MTDADFAIPPTQDPPGLIREPVEFWFIWTKGGRVPRFAHDTFQSAETEANRLAIMNPGRKFIILEAVSKRYVPAAPARSEAEQDAQAAAAMRSAA